MGGDVAEIDVVFFGVAAQDLEGAGLVEVISLHEDALGLADQLAAVQFGVEPGFDPRLGEGEGGVAGEDVHECDVVGGERAALGPVDVDRADPATPVSGEFGREQTGDAKRGDLRTPSWPATVRGQIADEQRLTLPGAV